MPFWVRFQAAIPPDAPPKHLDKWEGIIACWDTTTGQPGEVLRSHATNITALAVTIAFFNTYVYFSRMFVFPRFAMLLYGSIGAALLAASRAIKHACQRSLHRRGL